MPSRSGLSLKGWLSLGVLPLRCRTARGPAAPAMQHAPVHRRQRARNPCLVGCRLEAVCCFCPSRACRKCNRMVPMHCKLLRPKAHPTSWSTAC